VRTRLGDSLAVGLASEIPQIIETLEAREWLTSLGREAGWADLVFSRLPLALAIFAVVSCAAWTTMRLRQAQPRNFAALLIAAVAIFFLENWFTGAFVFFLWDAKVGMLWSVDTLGILNIILGFILKACCAVGICLYFSKAPQGIPPPNTSLERTREG